MLIYFNLIITSARFGFRYCHLGVSGFPSWKLFMRVRSASDSELESRCWPRHAVPHSTRSEERKRSELGRLGRTSHFHYTLTYSAHLSFLRTYLSDSTVPAIFYTSAPGSPSQVSIALITSHSRSYRPCQKKSPFLHLADSD